MIHIFPCEETIRVVVRCLRPHSQPKASQDLNQGLYIPVYIFTSIIFQKHRTEAKFNTVKDGKCNLYFEGETNQIKSISSNQQNFILSLHPPWWLPLVFLTYHYRWKNLSMTILEMVTADKSSTNFKSMCVLIFCCHFILAFSFMYLLSPHHIPNRSIQSMEFSRPEY